MVRQGSPTIGNRLIDDVNVFVGTDGFGNVYPGPQVPFGGGGGSRSVQWTVEPGDFTILLGSSSADSDLTPLPLKVK